MNLAALAGITVLLALAPPATPTTTTPLVSSAIPHGPVLVVAPHPDDEVLIAAGIIARSRRAGVVVDVAVMTNGGLGCERDGGVRQAESVTGLAALGVSEDHIHFLGLPDGSLADLGATPLPPIEQRDRDGRCVVVTTTSAWRGRGAHDVHTRRTGRPGRLTVDVAEDDLVALLDELKPALVVTTHELDTHPDHAATGILVRRALEVRAAREGTVPSPVQLWRGVVHVDDVWPKEEASHPPFTPDRPMPPLPSFFAGPGQPLRIPVDDVVGGPTGKLTVLAAHRSQMGPRPEDNWLAAFARTDEVVWPLVLVPASPTQLVPRLVRPQPPGAPPATVVEVTGASDVMALTVTLPSGPRRYRLWREGSRVVLEGGGRRRETRGVDVAGPGPLRVRAETFSDEGVVEFSVWRTGRLVALLVDPL
jgi:LmbE family N-acetylglucosaminyl deacetylase